MHNKPDQVSLRSGCRAMLQWLLVTPMRGKKRQKRKDREHQVAEGRKRETPYTTADILAVFSVTCSSNPNLDAMPIACSSWNSSLAA